MWTFKCILDEGKCKQEESSTKKGGLVQQSSLLICFLEALVFRDVSRSLHAKKKITFWLIVAKDETQKICFIRRCYKDLAILGFSVTPRVQVCQWLVKFGLS